MVSKAENTKNSKLCIDNATHAIQHIGDIPLGKERGQNKYMMSVLHVPNLVKNLVSVGQIVEQGMQVKFNKAGCFIEKHGTLIGKGIDMEECLFWM